MKSFFRRGVVAAALFLPFMPGVSTSLAEEIDSAAVAEARALLKEGREEMMRGEMQLTESESEAFWPIYYRYRDEVEAVRDRQEIIITDYMNAYWEAELNDALATRMLDEYFAIENAVLKIEQKYRKRFQKVLPISKVVRLYQLESKLQAEVDIAFANLVPLFDGS